jgi:transcriptional regulator GlxA family with amidase domain
VAQHGFADCPPLDLLLLPGGIGTLAQLQNPALLDFLRERAAAAERTLSVCSGSAILARAGLLDGRRATSNKQFFSLATGQSEKVEWVEQARWVEDGPFATSSGVSAGIDMALAVIARLYGRARAQEIADLTEYEWHSDAQRDPFARFLNQGMRALAALRSAE